MTAWRFPPLRHVLDGLERWSFASHVTRQVEREHAVAVVREVAALQDPDTVVVLGAVEDMLRVTRGSGLGLVLVCALDAVGELHDRIRQYPGAWAHVERTIAGLVDLRDSNPGLVVGIKTTVLPTNVHLLEVIEDYARERGLFAIISPAIVTAGRYLNVDREPDLRLDDEQRLQLAAFYEGGHTQWTYHGHSVARYLRTGRAKRPCTCGFNYFFVRSNGDVFLCPLFEESVGNLGRAFLASLLASSEARRVRRLVGRAPECAHCTEPGLERYSLPCEGLAYLGELFRRGPRRFLQMHRYLGLDKYV